MKNQNKTIVRIEEEVTNEDVINTYFALIHLDLALQKLTKLEKSFIWVREVKNKGNTFMKAGEAALQRYFDAAIAGGDDLTTYLKLKEAVRDKNFYAIDEIKRELNL